MRNGIIWLLPVVAFGSTGCATLKLMEPGVEGSGKVITKEIKLADFRAIELKGGANVEIVVGSPQKVEITTDDNIFAVLQSNVDGSVLMLSSKGMVSPTELRYRISVPALTSVDASGAISGSVKGIAGDRFKFSSKGASSMTLEGSVKMLELTARGAGSVDAEKLRAETVKVSCAGAGSISLFASDSLDASASGASQIRFAGNPKTQKTSASGVSDITSIR